MKRMQLFFRLGSWVLLVTAAWHLVGHFGAHPPLAGAPQFYSLAFALLLLFAGAINLAMLRVLRGRAKGLQNLSLMNVLLSAALVALSWRYFVLPPLVGFGVCLALFVLGLAAGHYQSEWLRPSSANLAPD